MLMIGLLQPILRFLKLFASPASLAQLGGQTRATNAGHANYIPRFYIEKHRPLDFVV